MRTRYIAIIALFCLLLASCSAAIISPQPEGPNTEDPLNPDAQYYADEMGITLEEANERLALQEGIGSLNADLEANEAATFAGLWLQHEPDYAVFVAFTKNGERTIRSYIRGQPYEDIVEVRPADYTLTELRAMQEELPTLLSQIEVDASSGIDVKTNRVVLYIGSKNDLLADLAAAGLTLPEAVVIEEIGGPDALNRPRLDEFTTVDGRTIHFPRQASAGAYMAALNEGVLIEENGCLRIKSIYGPGSSLVVWRSDHNLVSGEVGLSVVNGEGQVVARVGQPVSMGGGEAPNVPEELRVDGCPGPYWIAGDDAPAPDIQLLSEFYYSEEGILLLRQGLAAHYWGLEVTTIGGQIVEEDKCLRLAAEDDQSYLIVLPPSAAFGYDDDGMRIGMPSTHPSGWEPFIRPGEQTTLSGSPVTPDSNPELYEELESALPSAIDCTGPFWVVEW